MLCLLQQPGTHLMEGCRHRLQALAAAVGVPSEWQLGWSCKVLTHKASMPVEFRPCSTQQPHALMRRPAGFARTSAYDLSLISMIWTNSSCVHVLHKLPDTQLA